MASTTSKNPVESIPGPVFSYAQAAKGRVTSIPPIATPTMPAVHDVSTSAKELSLVSNAILKVNDLDVSDRDERIVNGGALEATGNAENEDTARDSERRASGSVKSISIPPSPASRSFASPVLPGGDDDDPSRYSNTSDVTGEQENLLGEPGAEKTLELAEDRRGKKQRRSKGSEKSAETDKEVLGSEALIAAPVPVVNIWQQRKEAQAARTKPTSLVVTETSTLGEPEPTANKISDTKRRSKPEDENHSVEGPNLDKGTRKGSEAKPKEQALGKKVGSRVGKVSEKDIKPFNAPAPPPVDDATSWPTPETALVEERRRSQDKVENKHEKDEGDDLTTTTTTSATFSKPSKKKEWVAVPFTPSVTFNTPLPPGRGRGRVGVRQDREREGAGRSTNATNVNATKDRLSHGPAKTIESNEAGDKRSRGDSGVRAASLPPNASKRLSLSGAPLSTRDQRKSGPLLTEKTKPGFPHNKNDASAQSGRPTSNTFQVDANVVNPTFSIGHDKGTRPSQSQDTHADVDAYGADRKGETNFRISESGFKDASAFGKDNHQARDRTEPRSDRGRGAFRNRNLSFMNGQHSQHAFTNGQGGLGNGTYLRHGTGPYSPPLPPQPFGHQFAPLPARGGRAGPRANSIPNNAMYGGRFTSSSNTHQMPPLQTSSTMYEYPQVQQTMSAIPYNPYVDQYSVLAMVTMQLEYYFSIDNLCKDVFLRKHMDSQGFVFLAFIAGFKRIQALSQEHELLRFACQESSVIEIIRGDDGKDRLRRSEGWEKWVLTMDERDESVRNAGPSFHRQLSGSRPQIGPPFVPGQPSASPQTFSPNINEGVVVSYSNGTSVGPSVNGDGHQHFPDTPLSAAVPDFAPGMLLEQKHDPLESETTFTDGEAELLILVFTSPKASNGPRAKQAARYASSRTFSNGSIDGGSLCEDRQDTDLSSRSRPSESSPDDIIRSRSPFAPLSPRLIAAPPVMWVKGQKQQLPISDDNTGESYMSVRAKALKQRESSSPGETHLHMRHLYDFWSHFLCRNFNPQMYSEFRKFALEDAKDGIMDGVHKLLTYYDEVLNSKRKTIPETIARHYVELIKGEEGQKDRPGFSKLRAAWRNGALDMKSRKKIDNLLDKKLKGELER